MMATIIRAGTEGTGEGEYNLKRIGVAIDEAEEDCDHYPPIQDISEKHRSHFRDIPTCVLYQRIFLN
jgi:hypothetical protein